MTFTPLIMHLRVPRCEIARRCSSTSRYDPRSIPPFRWSTPWADHDQPSSSMSSLPIWLLIYRRNHATTSMTIGLKKLEYLKSWSRILNSVYSCWRSSCTNLDCSTWASSAAAFSSSFSCGRWHSSEKFFVVAPVTGNSVKFIA